MDYLHYATYHPYLDMGHHWLPYPVPMSKAFPQGVNLGTTGPPSRSVAGKLLDMERDTFPSRYERRIELDRIRSKRRLEDFSSIPKKSYGDYLRPVNVDRVYISPWSSVFPSYDDGTERRVRQVGIGLPGSLRTIGLRREDQDLDPLTIEVEAEQVRQTARREARRMQSAMWESAYTDRIIRLCQERNHYRELERRLENARLVGPIYHCPDSHLGTRQKVLINYHTGGGTGDVERHPPPPPPSSDDVSTKVTVPLKRRKTLEDLEASEVDATVVVDADSVHVPSTEDDVAEQEPLPPAATLKRASVAEDSESPPKRVSLTEENEPPTPKQDSVDDESPPASKKPVKGKVPPKLSILKTKKSESVEDEHRVRTPRTPTTPAKVSPVTPSETEAPKTPTSSPVGRVLPITPTEADVPQSPVFEVPSTPETPTTAPLTPSEPEIPESPIYEVPPTPISPIEPEAPQSPIRESPTPIIPEPEDEPRTPVVEMKSRDRVFEIEDDLTRPEEEEHEMDTEKKVEEPEEIEEVPSSPPAPLRRLVSNVSNIEGDSCDPDEWLNDDDPPSIEIETDESRPRVILSATDVPSVLAQEREDEPEEAEETDRRRKLGSPDRQPSENAEPLSASTVDNENAEAGSALTGDEETLSANGRPLSIDAESLTADDDQPYRANEDNEQKMTVEEPDEVTLKSEEIHERAKSLSIEEQLDDD